MLAIRPSLLVDVFVAMLKTKQAVNDGLLR